MSKHTPINGLPPCAAAIMRFLSPHKTEAALHTRHRRLCLTGISTAAARSMLALLLILSGAGTACPLRAQQSQAECWMDDEGLWAWGFAEKFAIHDNRPWQYESVRKDGDRRLAPVVTAYQNGFPMTRTGTEMSAYTPPTVAPKRPITLDDVTKRGFGEALFGDGSKVGLHLSYAVQPTPGGLAQAFLIGEDFIGQDDVCMVLGDNIFYGNGLKRALSRAVSNLKEKKATVFGYYVPDPERFGVVEFDGEGRAVSIEEKPQTPKSNYAVVGLYFYPNSVVETAKHIRPSQRGELEITSVNQEYLRTGELDVITFGRGFTWLDTGTHESLADATAFVRMIEQHQGLKISCIEEIAFKNGWITREQLLSQAELMKNNEYGRHLKQVAEGKILY